MLKELPLFDSVGIVDYKSPNYNEIKEAKQNILDVMRKHDGIINVSYSAGKDSALLGQLALEVAEQIGESERIRFVMIDTNHNSEEAQKWHDDHVLPAFIESKTPILIASPSLFYNYFVQTLGRGVDCLSFTPKQTRCLGRWKKDVFSRVQSEYGGFYLTGRRKDESKRRARLLQQPNEGDVLANVSTATLWEYLKECKTLKFGLKTAELLEYYKDKKRDGCWCCPYGSRPNNIGLRRIVEFQEVWRESRPYVYKTPIEFWADFKKKYADKINPDESKRGKCGYCSLKHRKKLFHLLERTIERYNLQWILPPICKEMIFEFWNFAETFPDELGALCLTTKAFKHFRYRYTFRNPAIIPYIFKDYEKARLIRMVEKFKNF